MTVYVDEVGRAVRARTLFNMVSHTELSIIFCKPNGTVVIKTTADGVTLGPVPVVDEDLGSLAAREYIEYKIELGVITDADVGRWSVQAMYTNSNASPPDNFYGKIAYFDVVSRCNT